jgi:hypothetical protein
MANEYNVETRQALRAEPLSRDDLHVLLDRLAVPIRDDRVTSGSARLEAASSVIRVLNTAVKQSDSETRDMANVLDTLSTKTVHGVQSVIEKSQFDETGDTYVVREQAAQILDYERQTKLQKVKNALKGYARNISPEKTALKVSQSRLGSAALIGSSVGIATAAGITAGFFAQEVVTTGSPLETSLSTVGALAELNGVALFAGITLNICEAIKKGRAANEAVALTQGQVPA